MRAYDPRRRYLLLALGSVLATPRAALSQPLGEVRRIGFLYFGSRKAALDTGRLNAFLEQMSKFGYIKGTNLIVEERYADNDVARIPGVVNEMVRLNPEVIVATGGPTYRPLRNATSTIPIVITVTVDPIGAGYAATLARPGGNLTGLVDTARDLGPKHLELLLTVAPKISKVAVLLNPANPTHPAQLVSVMSAAQKLDKQILLIEARTSRDIAAGFATMARKRAQGLIVFGDTLLVDNREEIGELAKKFSLPSASLNPDYAQSGLLLSYGPNLIDHFRRAAVYVDKILKGAKPAELPFEQPTQYELTINLGTAKSLGLAIPQSLLQSADHVIE